MSDALTAGGILLVNKPAGITSHDAVGRVRRLYGTRQVGHTGTLDPMAEGLLVVLVGRAVKASEYSLESRKKYSAVMRLGLVTDTEDTTGTVISECSGIPSPDAVFQALKSFRGEIMQIPPMYSALKVDGKKLYELAREGKTVERTPRPVTVYSISASPLSNTDYRLDVECSSGTYIRTLCSDIGKHLGCGACMAALTRTGACGFKLEDAVTLEALESLGEDARAERLLPVEKLFASLGKITLPPFFEKLFRSGCEIYLRKLHAPQAPTGTRYRIYTESGEFIALGEVRDYPDGPAVKSIKLFAI